MKLIRLLLALVSGCLLLGAVSGCIPMPKGLQMAHKKPRIPWKDRLFQLTDHHPVEMQIKARGEFAGTVRLVPAPGHGVDTGSLLYRKSHGETLPLAACWQGSLVDAAEIRWPSGETWALFAWDSAPPPPTEPVGGVGGAKPWLRTISVYNPETADLFSCELEFGPPPPASGPKRIPCRFTWDPGRQDTEKYRRFLDTIKGSYAIDPTRGSETRGTVLYRQGETASVTFRTDDRATLQDRLLRAARSAGEN